MVAVRAWAAHFVLPLLPAACTIGRCCLCCMAWHAHANAVSCRPTRARSCIAASSRLCGSCACNAERRASSTTTANACTARTVAGCGGLYIVMQDRATRSIQQTMCSTQHAPSGVRAARRARVHERARVCCVFGCWAQRGGRNHMRVLVIAAPESVRRVARSDELKQALHALRATYTTHGTASYAQIARYGHAAAAPMNQPSRGKAVSCTLLGQPIVPSHAA